MKLGDSSGESMSSGGGSSAEEVFWERYRRLVLRAGVEEGVAVWYRRHVEGFIRFIKPRRLRQANVADVSQYLLKMHRREDTEAWQVRQQHEADVAAGYGDVYLPAGLVRKWANAGREWAWHWVFASERLSADPRGGKVRRHHVSEAGIQAAIKAAVWAAEVHKPASCHSLRAESGDGRWGA